MSILVSQIFEKFPQLFSEIIGQSDLKISEITPFRAAKSSSLSFVFKKELVKEALKSEACALVLPLNSKAELKPTTGKAYLLSSNPELAMALVIRDFFEPKLLGSCDGTISERAFISPTAKIDKDVSIGPFTYIGDNVTVKSGAQISANCVIEAGASVGYRSKLYPFVFIGRDCVVGNDCLIQSHASIGSQGFGYAHDKTTHYHKYHFGRVILKDRVDVGAGTMIDRGTIEDSVIGEGTKIDNLCHFGHNAVFGKNCLVTAGFVSAGSVKVGDNFVCGGRTTVAGHLSVCDNVTIAGHSTVGATHTEPGAFGGYPLVPLTTYKRNLLTTQYLAEMHKDIKRLIKKVFSE